MSAVVAAELLKLRTTPRTTIAFLVASVAVVALGTAGIVDSATAGPVVVEGALRDVVSGAAGTTVFFALLLGIVLMTTEYRHGTLTHTFLAAPRRELVVAGKLLTAALVGAALALLGIAAALAIAVPWLAADGRSPSLADADLAGDVARVVVAAALWGALGVAVGAVIRNQGGAIAAALVWFLVAESLVGVLFDRVGEFLPGTVLGVVLGWDESGLSTPAAGVVALAYVLGVALVATALTLRRDVG